MESVTANETTKYGQAIAQAIQQLAEATTRAPVEWWEPYVPLVITAALTLGVATLVQQLLHRNAQTRERYLLALNKHLEALSILRKIADYQEQDDDVNPQSVYAIVSIYHSDLEDIATKMVLAYNTRDSYIKLLDKVDAKLVDDDTRRPQGNEVLTEEQTGNLEKARERYGEKIADRGQAMKKHAIKLSNRLAERTQHFALPRKLNGQPLKPFVVKTDDKETKRPWYSPLHSRSQRLEKTHNREG